MRPPIFLRENRILYTVLTPVLLSGSLVSVFVIWYLANPLTTSLKSRIDNILYQSADIAVSICEERFDNLLELRMEDNAEMNSAYLREAVQQITSISRIHAGIKMLVIRNRKDILGATIDISSLDENSDLLNTTRGVVLESSLNGESVRVVTHYFPFWQLHIASLITESDYMAPVIQARRIVLFGSFGVLGVVLLTLLLLFVWRINLPLKKIITATREVAKGNLVPADIKGNDEIAEVGRAFNIMVRSLEGDQRKIQRIMAELRDSEEQYRILTENSQAYIAVIKSDQALFLNKKMLHVIGKPEDYNNCFYEVIHVDDRNMVIDTITTLERGESLQAHLECRIQTAERGVVWVEIQADLILYRESPAILIHGIDITLRKQEQNERELLEHKLSQAKKMEAIGTLAGGVAHDLNNILCGLVGYPELLMLGLSEDDPKYGTLKVIRESGQKASEIVQDLLTLARRGVTIKEVINLDSIINEYFNSPQFHGLKLRHPETLFEMQLSPDLMNIEGTAIHLLKTVMNLVTNAAEAVNENGHVVITTANHHFDEPHNGYELIPAGDYVKMSVVDNGGGISQKNLEKIFEPFFTSKKMNQSGTGLGMTVVWGVTHDHDGYVDITSEVGNGTTIEIFYPVCRRDVAAQKSEHCIEQYMGNHEKILLVDDVPEQLQLLEGLLEKLNYSTIKASSGEDAIAMIKKHPVDMVILDMIMAPGMDGLATYKKILECYPKQKAIIASGFSETNRVVEALSLGDCRYIKKPFTLTSISKVIRETLDS